MRWRTLLICLKFYDCLLRIVDGFFKHFWEKKLVLHRSVFVLVLVCHVAKLYPIRNLLISIILAIYQSKVLVEKIPHSLRDIFSPKVKFLSDLLILCTIHSESTLGCFACDVKTVQIFLLAKNKSESYNISKFLKGDQLVMGNLITIDS